jgi:hypothetical protein
MKNNLSGAYSVKTPYCGQFSDLSYNSVVEIQLLNFEYLFL